MPDPFVAVPKVYVDTETSGLSRADSPWEIALLRVDQDGTARQDLIHIANFATADADPKALNLAGLYERHPMYASDVQTAADAARVSPVLGVPLEYHLLPDGRAARLVERLTRGRLLVGCNPAFDAERMIAPLLTQHGYGPSWLYRPVCATTYAAGRLGLPPYLWKNEAIGEAFGVARDARGGRAHTALIDAWYAHDLLEAAVADAQEHPARDFGTARA